VGVSGRDTNGGEVGAWRWGDGANRGRGWSTRAVASTVMVGGEGGGSLLSPNKHDIQGVYDYIDSSSQHRRTRRRHAQRRMTEHRTD
jgi:hypothetical protein